MKKVVRKDEQQRNAKMFLIKHTQEGIANQIIDSIHHKHMKEVHTIPDTKLFCVAASRRRDHSHSSSMIPQLALIRRTSHPAAPPQERHTNSIQAGDQRIRHAVPPLDPFSSVYDVSLPADAALLPVILLSLIHSVKGADDRVRCVGWEERQEAQRSGERHRGDGTNTELEERRCTARVSDRLGGSGGGVVGCGRKKPDVLRCCGWRRQ